jgi:hypothetical protein
VFEGSGTDRGIGQAHAVRARERINQVGGVLGDGWTMTKMVAGETVECEDPMAWEITRSLVESVSDGRQQESNRAQEPASSAEGCRGPKHPSLEVILPR